MKKHFKFTVLTAAAFAVAFLFVSCRVKDVSEYRWLQQENLCCLVPEKAELNTDGNITEYTFGGKTVEIQMLKKEYFDSVTASTELTGSEAVLSFEKQLSGEEERELYSVTVSDGREGFAVNCGYFTAVLLHDGKARREAEITARSAFRNESLNSAWITFAAEKMRGENAKVFIERNKYGEAILRAEYRSDKRLIEDRIAEFCKYIRVSCDIAGIFKSDIPTVFTLLDKDGSPKMTVFGAYSFEGSEYIFEYLFDDSAWEEKYFAEAKERVSDITA